MDKWTLLASIVSILWAFFKGAGFFEMRRLAKLERLFQALEIGVSDAWCKIVKPWLLENPTAEKLPTHIREAAETHAIEAALKTDAIVKRYDCATVRATLKAAVEDAKRRGGK